MLGSLIASIFGTLKGRGNPQGAPSSNTVPIDVVESVGFRIALDYPYRPRCRALDANRSQILRRIAAGSDRYRDFLLRLATLAPYFERIPLRADVGDLSPRWQNGWFPVLDAITLYGMLAIHNPRWYVEVGSGYSTMFARQAIKDHTLRTSIISIDPFPRAGIDQICDRIIRQPCEDVDPQFFDSIGSEDVLFVDNSHRSFPNSDVTVFFTEILPGLPSGMIYGLHDIFLPLDYPDEWRSRFYNEQYLLASYLIGGARGDEIMLPNAFLSLYEQGALEPLAPIFTNPLLSGIQQSGAAFWLRRR